MSGRRGVNYLGKKRGDKMLSDVSRMFECILVDMFDDDFCDGVRMFCRSRNLECDSREKLREMVLMRYRCISEVKVKSRVTGYNIYRQRFSKRFDGSSKSVKEVSDEWNSLSVEEKGYYNREAIRVNREKERESNMVVLESDYSDGDLSDSECSVGGEKVKYKVGYHDDMSDDICGDSFEEVSIKKRGKCEDIRGDVIKKKCVVKKVKSCGVKKKSEVNSCGVKKESGKRVVKSKIKK